MNEITINGEAYVRKSDIPQEMAVSTNGLKYCIIRTYSAGVHAGYFKEGEKKVVKLVNARRLWKWAGAFTLSEMSKYGVSKPDECKFSTHVNFIILTEAIEIIPCTEKARESIEAVKDYEC